MPNRIGANNQRELLMDIPQSLYHNFFSRRPCIRTVYNILKVIETKRIIIETSALKYQKWYWEATYRCCVAKERMFAVVQNWKKNPTAKDDRDQNMHY